MVSLEETAIALAIMLIFSVLSYKTKSLDFPGVLAGNILGISVFLLGGIYHFFALVFFFAIGDIATRFQNKKKPLKFETRTIENIVGNGLPALICLALGLPFAFFGAISAALSDTLSSEIGMLSKRKPLLITNFKEVEKGTDGAITLLGYGAAFAGAILIAGIYFFLEGKIIGSAIIILAGIVGATADSLFGALFERKKLLGNTAVNFFGSSTGAITAFALSFLI